jgi:hypothetical protein
MKINLFSSKILWLSCWIVILSISPSNAQQPISTNINLFKNAIESVGAAGDAIAKLTDGIKHLVVTGTEGYDYVAARRDYNHLKELSVKSTDTFLTQGQVVVRGLDNYLSLQNPTPQDWYEFTDELDFVLIKVQMLLNDVRAERSDFVLEEAYKKLGASLGMRSAILSRFSELPPPVTPEEKAALRSLGKEYRRLLANFEEAITQLNLYLKSQRR